MAVAIDFDADMPENHGGTFIIDMIPNVSVTSHGITRKTTVFKIMAAANHTEDVLEGKYKAWLVDRTHVLLMSPSTNRVLREYEDDWVAAQKMCGHFDQNEHEARKIGKNQVGKDSHRKSVLILIDVGDIELTKEHHSVGTTDGELDWKFTPVPTNCCNPKLPQPLPHTTAVVTWKVAATPQANRVVDQQQQVRDPYAELAAMMQQNASLGHRQLNVPFQQQAHLNQGGHQQQGHAFGHGGMQQQHQLASQQGFQPIQPNQMQYQQPTQPQAGGYPMQQQQQPMLSPQQSGQYYGNQQVLSMPLQVMSPQQQGTPGFQPQSPVPFGQPQQQQQQPQQQQQSQQQQQQQQAGVNGSTSSGEGLFH